MKERASRQTRFRLLIIDNFSVRLIKFVCHPESKHRGHAIALEKIFYKN